MTDTLTPILPQDARDLYLDDRKEDASYDTRETIEPGVDFFIEWCESEEITNMNEVSGRELTEYKRYCKKNTSKNIVSLNGLLSVLRRFLVYCVQIDGVRQNVPDKVPIPDVPDDEDVCYEKPTDKEVERALNYLEKYEPGSRRHVEYAIMKEISSRAGALRAIDVGDVDQEEQAIKFKHRPHRDHKDVKGTPLKNGNDGQRDVNVSQELMELIQQYLNNPDRHHVSDKFGRQPLLTTRHGRPKVGTIRRDLYKLTRPCIHSNECPHDRDIDSCEAVQNNHASKCPSSYTPHPLRRWSIEHQIDQGVPKDKLSDRVDVSVPVLNKHYDLRSEERKRKQRLKVYERLFEGYGDKEETLDQSVIDNLTDDDGMLDPVALHELIAESEKSLDEISTSNQSGKEEKEYEQQRKGDQTSFEDFTGSNAISQPVALPVVGGTILGKWLPDRLQRELQDMDPQPDTPTCPSTNRAVKGAAAYTLYVIMVAVNFTLLGIIPV
ncbi:site-specific integrase [Halobacteriaceae archaeon SHR40]|uniref:tyrosine-type recombinase/integrase n=1 Tax=Halovenus amylolytica TaxID=2500550 RepID=UPI000FE3BDF9